MSVPKSDSTTEPPSPDLSRLTDAQRKLLESRLMRRNGQAFSGAAGAPAIPRRDPDVAPPISKAQRGLLLLDQISGGTNAYNVAQALRVRGRLDRDALRRALDELVARHEILRTRFPSSGDGGGRLEVLPPGSADLTTTTLPGEDAIEPFVHDAVRTPIDIASGSLLRACLGVLDETDNVLVLVTHHIGSDAVSKQVLALELSALYDAFSHGQESPLPAPGLQYADYAAWVESNGVGAADLDWWVKSLDGVPEQTDLPLDRARPLRPSFRGRHYVGRLNADLVERMRVLGAKHRVTTYMMLLAAFTALLERYGEQGEVVVGSSVSGRDQPGLDEVVGLFLNTLPVRVDTSGDPDFATLVARCRKASVAAMRHQSVPLDAIVDATRPPRATGRHPLFQTVLTHRPGPAAGPRLPGLDVTPLPFEGGWAKFDLSVITYPAPGEELRVLWEYNTDLFDDQTVEALATQMEALLDAALREPDRPISALRLTTPGDEARLAAWNDTTVDAPVACVHDLIAEQVIRTPDAPAVGDHAGWLTFAELDAQSSQLAHHLVELGVGPDSRVAVCLARSTQLEVVLLAIHKAGGAYVPLDPDYPADRVAFMLEDCGAVALVTDSRLALTVPKHGHTVLIDQLLLDGVPTHAPHTTVSPDNLAVIIYTSGSTGLPKGVMIEHRQLSNQLWRTQHYYDLGPSDTILQRSPYSFDFSCWELLLAPVCGARLFMAAPGRHGDPWYLAEVIKSEQVTMMNVVPSMLKAFLDSGVAAECGSLRIVNAGGERLPDEVKDECLRLLPGVRLENVYGPTETTVTVTSDTCTLDRPVSIGRLEPNCHAYVLDRHGQQVPPGMPGELLIGGAQVSRGYLDRPELTAERYVETEFGRLYRTGDRVAWKHDGRLQFLGRFDDQVKLRGFRIELGEIEAVLGSHPDVSSVCVAIVPAPSGASMLAAFVVPRDEDVATQATVRGLELSGQLDTLARSRLPGHMVPSTVLVVPNLPLTGSGKLDRRGVARFDPSPQIRGYVVPANDTEERLAGIWERELGIGEPISTDASYFDLGGTSLLALRVFPIIEREFRVKLALSMLFENVTIGSLARAIEAARGTQNPWDTLYTIQPHGDRLPMFALPAARGDALTYLQIAPHLNRDRPTHVVQARGLDGRVTPRTRLEDVAEDALEVIRRVQPHGPYHLLGFCYGGVVAYDVAIRLREAGEEVGLLCLIDSTPFGRGGNARTPLQVHKWRRRGWKWLWSRVPVRVRHSRNMAVQTTLGKLGISVPQRFVDIVEPTRRASRRYVTPDSDLHINLLRASSGDPVADEAKRKRWASVTSGGCELHILQGGPVDHTEVIRGDFAPRIAQFVNARLSNAP